MTRLAESTDSQPRKEGGTYGIRIRLEHEEQTMRKGKGLQGVTFLTDCKFRAKYKDFAKY